MAKYTVTLNFDKFELEADFTNAASTIYVDGEATQWQVADARHNTSAAVRLIVESRGTTYWRDDEEYERKVAALEDEMLDEIVDAADIDEIEEDDE